MRKMTFQPETQVARKEKSVYSQDARDAPPLSYRKLVGAKATKLGSVKEI